MSWFYFGFLSIVTTYPSAGGPGKIKRVRLLMKKTPGVATNVYSRKMLKNQKEVKGL